MKYKKIQTKSGVDEEAMARLRREVVGMVGMVEKRMGRASRRNILKTFLALGDQVISSPRERKRH
jgi:hypothetical protein